MGRGEERNSAFNNTSYLRKKERLCCVMLDVRDSLLLAALCAGIWPLSRWSSDSFSLQLSFTNAATRMRNVGKRPDPTLRTKKSFLYAEYLSTHAPCTLSNLTFLFSPFLFCILLHIRHTGREATTLQQSSNHQRHRQHRTVWPRLFLARHARRHYVVSEGITVARH